MAKGSRLRPLASDYNVAHTTLGRYFERPEVAKQLRQAAKQLQAEREQERRARAAVAERTSRRRRRPRSAYEAWLDEHDERRPLTRADLYSQSDDIAARAVAARGGMQDVIDATGLRTLENVVRLIDPAILKDAYDNDLLRQAQPPPPT